MIHLKTITITFFIFIYSSISYGDTCQINGLEPEVLKNLSYDPPSHELLSNEQDKKAWQTFVDTYENPTRKAQSWYNSIVDKASADAAAGSFNTQVLPILQKLTGRTADMKKQVLAIPASAEMQKFILLRILQLQSRLLVMFLPMQNERGKDADTCYRGSNMLFETILGLTSPSSMSISKFIESRNETQEDMEAAFKEPWAASPSFQE